jgi:hypothetical protein
VRQSRRVFLRALGGGVAFVTLPELSSIFSLLPGASATEEDIAASLRRLFLGRDGRGGPFVAHAETFVTESAPQQLLGSPSALVGILEQLGVEKTFSQRVGYGEASQCRPHFESQEGEWRKRLGDDTIFTNVRRSPLEKDVAVLVSGKVNAADNTLERAEGAVQYQHKAAVRLAGRDPGIILATPAVVRDHFRLSGKELAKSFALVEPRSLITMDDGQRAHRYETPVSSVVYIPRPRRNNRVGSRAVGVLAVNMKHKPGSIYFADLYE